MPGQRLGPVEQANQTFYDELYHHRHPLLVLVHGFISFDQQSKARPNAALVRRLLPELRTRGHRQELRALDYGCGWGATLRRLRGAELRLYGYDASSGALHALRRSTRLLGPEIRLAEIDADGRLTPGNFDVIICSHVLEHVPDDDALMTRLADALTPGGYLVANIPIHELWEDPKHARRYDQQTLMAKLRKVGLEPCVTWEGDRWSAFLIERECVRGANRAIRITLRILRALLAFMPLSLLERTGDRWLSGYPRQQCLVAARKGGLDIEHPQRSVSAVDCSS